MAFPTSSAPAATNISTAVDPHTVNLPAGLAESNIALALSRVPAANRDPLSFPIGWTILKSVGQAGDSSDRITIAYKYLIAGDAEIGASTMSVDTDTTTTRKGAWLVWRIVAAENPATLAPAISADATGNSTTPDPSAVSAPGGIARDYLVFWLGAWEGEQTSPPASNPTNYGLYVAGADTGTGGAVATNARVAGAAREINFSTTEDPPPWTINVGDDWIAWAVAFAPTSATPKGPPVYSSPQVNRSMHLIRR